MPVSLNPCSCVSHHVLSAAGMRACHARVDSDVWVKVWSCVERARRTDGRVHVVAAADYGDEDDFGSECDLIKFPTLRPSTRSRITRF